MITIGVILDQNARFKTRQFFLPNPCKFELLTLAHNDIPYIIKNA